jgi:hypothetical protein
MQCCDHQYLALFGLHSCEASMNGYNRSLEPQVYEPPCPQFKASQMPLHNQADAGGPKPASFQDSSSLYQFQYLDPAAVPRIPYYPTVNDKTAFLAPPLHQGTLPGTITTSAPRKILTDEDRRRMCEYAEQHPQAKQTDIGNIFGLERR